MKIMREKLKYHQSASDPGSQEIMDKIPKKNLLLLLRKTAHKCIKCLC